jgi:hypothetical protein
MSNIPGTRMKLEFNNTAPRIASNAGVIVVISKIPSNLEGKSLKPIGCVNYQSFLQEFGDIPRDYPLSKSMNSLFANGASLVYVIGITGESSTPTLELKSKNGLAYLKLTPKKPRIRDDEIFIKLAKDEQTNSFHLEVSRKGVKSETYPNISIMNTPDEIDVVDMINQDSKLLNAERLIKILPEGDEMTQQEGFLRGGTINEISLEDYELALQQAAMIDDADFIVTDDTRQEVHDKISAHCEQMSEGKGIYQYSPRCAAVTLGDLNTDELLDRKRLSKKNVILVTPQECLWAVAGRLSSIEPHQSSINKQLNGVTIVDRYSLANQNRLIEKGFLVCDFKKGYGNYIVNDYASDITPINEVRSFYYISYEINKIAEKFVGMENTGTVREALIQACKSFLLEQVDKGRIVPNPDPNAEFKEPFAIQLKVTDRNYRIGELPLLISIFIVGIIRRLDITLFQA